MSAIPVTDTISEIMERISSLRDFGPNITENIKHHLTVIKEKCSSPAKLDLSDPATQAWVAQVSDLFYLVDDLCSEAALLRKKSKMMSLLSACNLKPLLQLKQIEKRLVREVAAMKNVKMLPTWDAEEEEAEAVVRDYVKERIVDLVLGKKQGVVGAVVIRGVTGTVKGRAAKYVCEDEKVKSGFDVVTWIDGDHPQLQEHFAESVVDRVKRELEEEKKKESGEGKGFLLVLNNFQNKNREEWLKLANKLKEVAAASSGGGALLVTTIGSTVAYSVKHSFEPKFAEVLQSRVLFERIAGASASAIESETRDGLLDMCGEVLGEIETMAWLVRSRKPTTESEIKQLKDEFVQAMQLKYYSELDLPSWRLRQCFSYSLFIFSSQGSVKDEELIRLWMAEGFLGHSCSSPEPEDLGRECLKEFCRRELFQVNENREIGIFKWPVPATVVLGTGNVCVKDNGIIGYYGVRRVSLSSDWDVSKGIPRSLLKSNKNVRAILVEEPQSRVPNQLMLSWSACHEIFSRFTRLRVLTLKDLGMKALPASIGDLKDLRYLDLSRNNLKKLPICIGELQHLQTLLLSHCYQLRQLPHDVNHFPGLRHLELDQCLNLTHMPSALKKLTWLRSLSHFVTSNRNGLGELIHLNQLSGGLEISHLERIKFKGSRVRAYLKEKQHLEGLTLRWNHEDEDEDEKKHSDQNQIMLTYLEPHSNLKRLSVISYGGNQFAGWLSSLNNLVELSLYNCPKCESLPTLDRVLVNLERLTLMSLDSLQFITVTEIGCKELKLKRVRISDCPNLESWWKTRTHRDTCVFSAILELVVEFCPKLVSMPLFPDIRNMLVLDSSNMEPFLKTLRYKSTGSGSSPPFSKLAYLTIVNVDRKQYPPQEEWLKNFTSLVRLEIRDCKALNSIQGWSHLTSLESLHISNCTDGDLPSEGWEGMENLSDLVIQDMSDLKSLPEGMKHLEFLDNLEIKNCPQLTTLPEDFAKESPPSVVLVEDCPKLASLPGSMKNLIKLDIRNCPLLEAWNQSIPKLDLNPLSRAPSILSFASSF